MIRDVRWRQVRFSSKMMIKALQQQWSLHASEFDGLCAYSSNRSALIILILNYQLPAGKSQAYRKEE